MGKTSAPGPQQKRFAAYLDGLAKAAGHADRSEPLKSYCKGLLLPLERKSVEPMAAKLAPDNVRRMHQSLHHLVADAPWSDEELLTEVRSTVLPTMQEHGPVAAWIVDDTGFPKKGKHSVGVVGPSYHVLTDATDASPGGSQLWFDPRRGSDKAFLKALGELSAQSKHPELATVPWALWGHSGGGIWSDVMTTQYPDRVAAAFLRSGSFRNRPDFLQPETPAAAYAVPGPPWHTSGPTRLGSV